MIVRNSCGFDIKVNRPFGSEISTSSPISKFSKSSFVELSSLLIFIPNEINLLLIKREASRGKHLIGVYWHNASRAFKAQVSKSAGKQEHLGYFKTEIEAFKAYKQAKESFIKEQANKFKSQIDPRAYNALMNYQVEVTD